MTETSFAGRLARAVESIETRSDAEVVVVGKTASGGYADLDLGWGILAGGAALVVLLFAPPEVPPGAVLPIAAAACALGALISRRTAALRRLVARRGRGREQAAREARATFFDEKVAATKRRTGLLFYYSAFEGELVILADSGVEAKVEQAIWNGIEDRFHKDSQAPEERLLGALETAGALLAERLPAIPGDNPDELESTPRWMQ